MAYSDFSIDMLKEDFGLTISEDQPLFPLPPTVAVPESLSNLLERYIPLALNISTEKARSEFMIAPVLAELKFLHRNEISLFSGVEFNVDEARGLKGRCDYIISKSREQLVISAPVCVLVEAKNENITGGIPQCLAEMIAAREFNQRKGNAIPAIYGVVTTGSLWRFLKLVGNQAFVDTTEYPVQELDQILGILQTIATAN
jgi:hypothetical protein